MATFAKTFDVDISTGKPAASNEAYYHGETIEFRAVRGRSVVTNIEYASVYYQTNGMGDAWWKTDGLVFHPTNDVGAASYRFFLEGRDDLGRDWHANGLLRLLDSPGFTPNVIEHPVLRLDFAAIDVANAPYYTKDETEAKIDYSPANGELAATIAEVAPAPELSEHGGFSDWDIIPKLPGTISAALKLENGKWYLWMQQSGEDVRKISSIGKGDENSTSLSWDASETGMSNFTATRSGLGRYYVYGDNADKPIQPAGEYAGLTVVADAAAAATNYTDAATNALADVAHSGSYNDLTDAPSIPSNVSNIVTKAYVEDLGIASEETDPTVSAWAKQPAKPNYTASEVDAYPAADGAQLSAQVSALGATLAGEDARFVSTNYDSNVHIPEAYLEIKISNNWLTVWREMRRWDAFAGRDFDFSSWIGFNAWRTNIEHEINFKADRAWGAYDSETGGFSPEGYTQISSSNILIAAGMAYQRTITSGGAVWVLQCNRGTAHIGGDTNGFFRVVDGDGVTQFEIVKGDKRELGADADGITVSGDVVTIPYSIEAEEPPVLQICDDLRTADWKPETSQDCIATVSWSGMSGAYVATVQRKTPGTSLFVKATYMAGGETYIRNAAPVSMDSIIINGTKYYLGTATISGHTVLTLSTTAP